jgi:glycosyltransferase involved in cell wall biosynthesis
MFSAQFLSDPRKGGSHLRDALIRLRTAVGSSQLPVVLAVGAGATEWQADGFQVRRLENVTNDETMAAAYSAADVFVLPTLAENLPNGVIESMACGTPAVAFDVGGCGEAVRHMRTGYLARYRDTADFAEGIRLLLDDPSLRCRLAAEGRRVAESEYGLMLQAKRHAALYEELTRNSGSSARHKVAVARGA